MPALITPFDKDEKLLSFAAERVIRYEMDQGVDGFYINGATGEGLFLPEDTRKELAEMAVGICKGKVSIIDHVGAVDPCSAFRLAHHAGQIGCDAISSLVPNYIAQYNVEQILDYYRRLADEASLPVIVYCNSLMQDDPVSFMEKAIQIDGVIGIKYTNMNYYNLHRITMLNEGNINVINGPDEMLVCGLLMGADGGIGSTYNVMADRFVKLYKAFMQGDIEGARDIQYGINAVISVILKYGCIPAVKQIMTLMGFDVGNIAYPGKCFSAEETGMLVKDLKDAGFEL